MIESQNVEFKESWKDEYLKTLCAFANERICGLPKTLCEGPV